MKIRAFKIDEDLRRELGKPWGLVVTNNEVESGRLEEILNQMSPHMIITVGDVTTHTFLERGIRPRVAIVDMKTLRGPYQADFAEKMKMVCEVVNPPGHIVSTMVEHVKEAIDEGGFILVKGEEDLLVIPSIIASPEGAVIAYGQPGVGVVLIKVDKDKREKARELLRSMREVELDVDAVPG
ncbi:MAG: DUF359 domain-containing protein [Candidatus Nezhaarchaeales archaeon]|nr:MAG: DUF359 domain-containing protein [Candidatus Nezhaarchaeota archaeon WYZ-LMO8]